MTGEKNRYSTVEKLWKLDDTTLKTPKHDEMVIWLLNKTNICSIFPKYEQTKLSLLTGENKFLVDFWRETDFENEIFWNELAEKKCNSEKVPEDLKADWKYIIDDYHTIPKTYPFRISSEVPLTTATSFIVGYWDIIITVEAVYSEFELFRKGYSRRCAPKYIEVKPTIDSFGATLRQLRTYQEYERNAIGNTYLFTPDLRFKDAFESQGIMVISPP